VTTQDKTIVGKKGEILAKKTLREISGIKPGDEIIIEAHLGQLLIKKIYSIDELLEMPIISVETSEEIAKEIEEESKKQQEMSD
jgi:bifunctional DNA-binding transcriptional regulator/antitoxin component of YhaV-PrlF toxin-antitoxin module